MLLEPLLWLAKAELLFIPLDGPLKALLVLGLGVFETSRLATRSPPPLMRFCGLFEGALAALRLLAAGCWRTLLGWLGL